MLNAAATLGADVLGFDFNPEQIEHDRRLSARAGLANVTFADMSLQELAELPRADLPDFDVVTVHWVYNWISPKARGAIGVFLQRKLKPGGLVYISYNAMPSYAAVQPLQLLVEPRALSRAAPAMRRPGQA